MLGFTEGRPVMSSRLTWTAFLMMCFALVGMAGLFASFATTIPWERAVIRGAVLDSVLDAARAPDAPARLEGLRPVLGPIADRLFTGPGDIRDRVAAERATMLDEQRREADSVAHRIRILVIVVTVMAALVGAGIMALAVRTPQVT